MSCNGEQNFFRSTNFQLASILNVNNLQVPSHLDYSQHLLLGTLRSEFLVPVGPCFFNICAIEKFSSVKIELWDYRLSAQVLSA